MTYEEFLNIPVSVLKDLEIIITLKVKYHMDDSLCGDMGGIHRIREVNKLNDYPHHYTHWLPHWAIKIPTGERK
jgi:hypothetical protein